MVYEHDWKGKRKDLNIVRSFLAYKYRTWSMDLKDEHKEELDELKSHYLRRFPSYKQWLVDQDSEDVYRTYC